MKYRFMLNVTLKGNFAFKELESGLYLNYEHPLGYVEAATADEVNDKIRSAVIFNKIIDLDGAFTDITDHFSDRKKACINAIIKKFDIQADTLSIEPLNAITNGYRDKETPPIVNNGVYHLDLIPQAIN